MLLGADAISIELDGEALELRPTLRAGLRLARRHGLTGLIAAVRDFNTTIIADVLGECGIAPSLLTTEIEAHGLAEVQRAMMAPLANFVLAVLGVDPDAEPNLAPAKQPTVEHYTSRLFEIATGWLGWTPEEAWNATVPEIIAARAGRLGMIEDVLGAIFGTPSSNTHADYTAEQLAEIEELGHDPAFDRAGLAALKQKVAR